jgi:hypothetical protein
MGKGFHPWVPLPTATHKYPQKVQVSTSPLFPTAHLLWVTILLWVALYPQVKALWEKAQVAIVGFVGHFLEMSFN